MIRYALKCRDGHGFESWFQSSGAYDALAAGGHLTCAVCGAGGVVKAVMAPAIAAAPSEPPPAPRPPLPPASPASPFEAALARLRAHVEAHAEHVGPNFAAEARRIHEGAGPARAIYGQATAEEARALLADDIPVAPLPWPVRSTN